MDITFLFQAFFAIIFVLVLPMLFIVNGVLAIRRREVHIHNRSGERHIYLGMPALVYGLGLVSLGILWLVIVLTQWGGQQINPILGLLMLLAYYVIRFALPLLNWLANRPR